MSDVFHRHPFVARNRCLCVVLALLVFSSHACRGVYEDRVKLAYVNWADSTAMTFLAKAVLEERMGYRVETTMADAAPVFTSVADGGHDAFLNAWLPVTHADYMKKFGDKLVDLGPNYAGTRIGLVVPNYVQPRSISDLNAYRNEFGGEIVGIDSGAGIMQATERAVDRYQLRYKLLPSSEAAMTASLKQAIDRREPVVVTGWKPHWKFARWKLRFLDDPKDVYSGSENIHTVVRPGFVKEKPDVAEFLRRFRLKSDELQELMDVIRTSEEPPAAAAKRWMRNHSDVVDAWTAGLKRDG